MIIFVFATQSNSYDPKNKKGQSTSIIPWPKPFTNLRSTCETELNEEFPSHVVANWLGHSVKIATKHYLQVTEEHHQRALAMKPCASKSTAIDVTCCEQNSNRPESIVQKCVQSASAGDGNGQQMTENDIFSKKQKMTVTSLGYKWLQSIADYYRIVADYSKNGQTDGEGFEPTDESPRRRFSRPVP